MSQHEVTLLLGSNLGNPEQNINNAIAQLEAEFGTIVAKTQVLETAPVEFVTRNYFCNIALIIKTQYSPLQVLRKIKEIEHRMGRTTDTSVSVDYQDRIIDIDVVFFDAIKYYCRELRIPHEKHQYERKFSRTLLNELMREKAVEVKTN